MAQDGLESYMFERAVLRHGSIVLYKTLQESSTGKNTRKKFSSRIYLRAGQFKARKKFSSLM